MTDTLFKPATKNMGRMKGLGAVVLREAIIGDLWPYMGEMTGAEFPLRVLAASMSINGQPVTFEQLNTLGMRHLKQLQKLLPEVMAINGFDAAGGEADEDDEEEETENPPQDAAA